MLGIRSRSALLFAAFSLLIVSCGGEAAPPTTIATTTTSSTTTSTTTTTTTTTIPLTPSGPAIIRQGDLSETVAAFQFLLNCNEYSNLQVDGLYGPEMLPFVEAAQTALNRAADGAPDEATMAELSRSCSDIRVLEADPTGTYRVVGNTAPGDPATFSVPLLENTALTVTTVEGSGVTVLVHGADGTIPAATEVGWTIDSTQDYIITASSLGGAITFTLDFATGEPTPEVGSWVLAGDSLTFGDTTLALGDDAQTVIDTVYELLGHEIRGRYDEFDTGWYEIDDPQVLGIRGVSVGGISMLFFGPSSAEPTREETLARIRVKATKPDANGEARADNYITTSEGIAVGSTLAELQSAYDATQSGSNDNEHYYSLADSGGTLCFYFGANAPTESSTIIEIATECRS